MKRTASPDSPMFESMHRFRIHEFVVRVWREEENLQQFYELDDLRNAELSMHGEIDATVVSRAFHRCGRVTAVEVLDHRGNGSVTYTVWP